MREFFVSRIKSGVVHIQRQGITIYVNSPTILENLESNYFAIEAYEDAEFEGVMSQEEMLEWMINNGLWSEEDEERMSGLKKDIEKLTVEIYKNREDDFLREQIRKGIRAGEQQYTEVNSKKTQFEENTCEGVALLSKHRWIIENCCTFSDGRPYDFENISPEFIMAEYQRSFLSETQLRELARTEPWKSQWSISDKSGKDIFLYPDRELTNDQKGLLIWSNMYDNIQEHMECPPNEVIEDDDVLDGWFLIQREKRKKEKLEQEFEENTNSKINNAHEVFMVGNKSQEKVDTLNSPTAKMFKNQREKLIKQKGHVEQGEFFDEKLGMRGQQNDMYKNKFK